MNYQSKNEWYLISSKLIRILETGSIYYECVYSNGLITRTKSIKVSEFIPTVISEL
jgi:hypothetical protein